MSWFSPQPIFWQDVFFRYDIFCVSVLTSPLFLLYGKCGTYPLLMISCSIPLELYALSRHRCCSFLFPTSFVLGDEICLLITALSTTSVTNFISCVLADDMTTERGMPSLSVKICIFVPSLLLSVGLLPVIAPLKETL